ncbi:MAG: hypothetical protein AAF378_24735 [Cyanobacteria bacterium P01_A01_bin.84]
MLKFKSFYPYLLLGMLGLTLPISTAITLAPIQPAYACKPGPGSQASTLAQRIDKTPIVFQGIVRKIDGDTITIQVKRYFKNNGSAIVKLKGFNLTSCDNFIQKPGERFLFFADNRDNQPWNAVYDGAFGSVRSWNRETRRELRKLGLIGVRPGNMSKCNFDSRKTVETVESQVGRIEGNIIIAPGNTKDNSKRFAPCNLPKKFQQDGLMILFSGEVKEIYPHERWAGTPFKITKYKLVR